MTTHPVSPHVPRDSWLVTVKTRTGSTHTSVQYSSEAAEAYVAKLRATKHVTSVNVEKRSAA